MGMIVYSFRETAVVDSYELNFYVLLGNRYELCTSQAEPPLYISNTNFES